MFLFVDGERTPNRSVNLLEQESVPLSVDAEFIYEVDNLLGIS